MIITEPAAAIISDTFNLGLTRNLRNRLKGRQQRTLNPFTTQAYAEAGVAPASKQAATGVSPSLSATERRRSPLR